MPRPEAPDYALWKGETQRGAGEGHRRSGVYRAFPGRVDPAQIPRQEPLRNPIAGMFLVSVPFWSGDEDWVQPFILPEDFATRLPAIPKLFLYHSKNDPHVPVSHQVLYAQALPRAAVRVLDGEDHEFSHGIPQLVADLKRLKG
jgi:predicted alpha/beta hydrolase family esterase